MGRCSRGLQWVPTAVSFLSSPTVLTRAINNDLSCADHNKNNTTIPVSNWINKDRAECTGLRGVDDMIQTSTCTVMSRKLQFACIVQLACFDLQLLASN